MKISRYVSPLQLLLALQVHWNLQQIRRQVPEQGCLLVTTAARIVSVGGVL